MNRRHVRAPLSLRVVAAVGLLTALPISAHADDGADGRRHAQRASALAAKGKCKQAVGEYDKAIAVLHDPALLFNRGECHRKLGNTESALEDYNQFLADLPTAPNRAQVESRIAELKKTGPAAAPPSAAASPAASPVASPAASPVHPGAGAGAGASSPVSANPVPKIEPRKPSGESAGGVGTTPLPAVGVAPGTTRVPAGAPGTTDSSGGSNSLLLSNQPSPPPPAATSDDSLVSHPWFWIAVGAVVVGAGIGAYLVLGSDGTSIPASDLGNYKF